MKSRHKNNQAWAFLMAKSLLLSVLVASLMACGFHLKGMGPNAKASFQSVYLAKTTGVRADALKTFMQLLKASDVKVVDSVASAELSVSLDATVYEVSRTSMSGQGDTTSELLKMSQTVSVQRVATETLLMTATVNSYRDRRIETAAALGSSRELQDIQQQMAFDVANQLIDRINRAYQLKQPSKPTQAKDQGEQP
ncbi:hypothetical protein CYQ88_02285 [Hydrogenovibrio sp. SC-1]|uniref:LPS-assembly lipoprotein LptE n=1 Tax=Hydrogenovibrio sp. SC-1 TaxID=2065820 RepID=UPI000C79FF37|nr:hypothetical protein [Hydrogenovibrio sp. SC-1]PLA75079.1 hypothetical protein CYQ88_02285 [Hydrogenovibrio sp. SC-1]